MVKPASRDQLLGDEIVHIHTFGHGVLLVLGHVVPPLAIAAGAPGRGGTVQKNTECDRPRNHCKELLPAFDFFFE